MLRCLIILLFKVGAVTQLLESLDGGNGAEEGEGDEEGDEDDKTAAQQVRKEANNY